DIGHFVVRKYRHTSYDVDVHYIIDTISETLLKCGYYEYSQETRSDRILYKTTFYYDNGDFKLAVLQISSKGRSIPNVKLYFINEQDQIVQMLSSTNNETWDLARIQKTTKQFLLDFAGILAM